MSRSILRQLLQSQFKSKELRARIEDIYLNLEKKSGNKALNDETQRIYAVIAAFFAVQELREGEKETKRQFQRNRKQEFYRLNSQGGQVGNHQQIIKRKDGEDLNENNSSKSQNESSKLFQSSEGSIEEEDVGRASNGESDSVNYIKTKQEDSEIEREGEGYLEDQRKKEKILSSSKSRYLLTENDKNLLNKLGLVQLKQAFCPGISMERILQKMKESEEGQGDCLKELKFSHQLHKKTTEINWNYQIFSKLLQMQDELQKSSRNNNQSPDGLEPRKNCASLIWKVFLLLKQRVNRSDSSDQKKLIFLLCFICEQMLLKNFNKRVEINQVKDGLIYGGQQSRQIIKAKLKEFLSEGKFDVQKMKVEYSAEFRKIFKKIEKKINRKIEKTQEQCQNKDGDQWEKQSEGVNNSKKLRLFFDGNDQNLHEIELSVNKIIQESNIFEECNFFTEMEGIEIQKKLAASKKLKAIQQQRQQAENSLTNAAKEGDNKKQLEEQECSSQLFSHGQISKNNGKEIILKEKQSTKDNTTSSTKLLGELIDKGKSKIIQNVDQKQPKSFKGSDFNDQRNNKNNNSYPDIVVLQASEKEAIINKNSNQSNQLLSPNYIRNKHANPQSKSQNAQQPLEQQQQFPLKPRFEQAVKLSNNKSANNSNTYSSSSHALDKLKWLNLNSKSEPTTRINEIMFKLGNTYNMNSINNVTSSTDNSFQVMIASKMAQTSRDIFYLNKKCTDQPTLTPDEIEGLVNKTVCLFQNFLERMIHDEQQKLVQLGIEQQVEQKRQQQQLHFGSHPAAATASTGASSASASDQQSSEELILNLFVNKTFLFALLCICIMTMCFAKDITRISLRFILSYCSISPLDYWRIISNFARLDKNMPFSVQEYLFQQEKQILLYNIWDCPDIAENILANINQAVRRISPLSNTDNNEHMEVEETPVESSNTIATNTEKIDIENTPSADIPAVNNNKNNSTATNLTTSAISPTTPASSHLYGIVGRRLICHCAMRVNDMGQLLGFSDTIIEFVWQGLMDVLLNKQELLAKRYIDNIVVCCIYSLKISNPPLVDPTQLKIRDLLFAFSALPFFSLNKVGWQQKQLQQLHQQSQNNNNYSQNSQSNWQVLAENIQITNKTSHYSSNPNKLVKFYNQSFLNCMKAFFKSLVVKNENTTDAVGAATTAEGQKQLLQGKTTQLQLQQLPNKQNQESLVDATNNNNNSDVMICETQSVKNNQITNNNNQNSLSSVDCTLQNQQQDTPRIGISSDENNNNILSSSEPVVPQTIPQVNDLTHVLPLKYTLPIPFTAFSFVKANKKTMQKLYCK